LVWPFVTYFYWSPIRFCYNTFVSAQSAMKFWAIKSRPINRTLHGAAIVAPLPPDLAARGSSALPHPVGRRPAPLPPDPALQASDLVRSASIHLFSATGPSICVDPPLPVPHRSVSTRRPPLLHLASASAHGPAGVLCSTRGPPPCSSSSRPNCTRLLSLPSSAPPRAVLSLPLRSAPRPVRSPALQSAPTSARLV
jgi:hypothetical protein